MQISSQGSPGSCRLVTFRPQGVAAASRDGAPRAPGENDTNLAQSWAFYILFLLHLLSFLRSCHIIFREQVLG